MNVFDVKDRKILYQLDINSRQSNAEIARAVGLSKQVVGFRIKRLVERKVISSFYSVIDIAKLGFTVHKNFIRLQNLDQGKEKELINFLQQHPDVVWVASCDGAYDLAFGTWAKNMEQLDHTLTELNKLFGQYIAEREIATIIKGEYYIRDYLLGQDEVSSRRASFFGAVPKPVNMDEQDWNILRRIAEHARKTAVELGQEIHLSADAVIHRIKNMEKSGVIQHYNIVPNESQYPYQHYKVLIGFRNISPTRESTLKEYCHINPNIVYTVKALASWDFEIDLEVESREQLREIMMEIKTQFSDILKDYTILHIYQVHKYNFCPSTHK